ncbi:hypothetical protein C8Q80DRAFT_1147798 [Daedaleopsis nitida]|nr:hypothetical protein C8Q80DRAFT_1147798 [Daedaleopsis nitida]
MNVSFATNDPFNSIVVNEATGELLFEVSTPFNLGKRTTTIRDAHRKVVAEYQRRWGHDRVTYHGETRQLSEWLPKKGRWSSSRMLLAPNGKAYQWKQRGSSRSFRLLDAQSTLPVAESHRARHGFFTGKRRNLGIEVGPEAVPFLDAVLLSFIVCEKERRERASASASAGAAAGASAGGGGSC